MIAPLTSLMYMMLEDILWFLIRLRRSFNPLSRSLSDLWGHHNCSYSPIRKELEQCLNHWAKDFSIQEVWQQTQLTYEHSVRADIWVDVMNRLNFVTWAIFVSGFPANFEIHVRSIWSIEYRTVNQKRVGWVRNRRFLVLAIFDPADESARWYIFTVWMAVKLADTTDCTLSPWWKRRPVDINDDVLT